MKFKSAINWLDGYVLQNSIFKKTKQLIDSISLRVTILTIRTLKYFVITSSMYVFGILSFDHNAIGLDKESNMNLGNPPIAKKISHKINIHNQELSDDYFWLRDQKWPNVENKEILAYLKYENEYTEKYFKPLKSTVENLYNEIIGRIKLADRSVPVKNSDNYYYFRITEETSDYPIYVRKQLNNKEETILDQNQEAKGHKFFKIGALSVSSDGKLLAYSEDTSGNENFTIKVKDLRTKKILSDTIKDSISSIVWDKNNRGFYYIKVDDKWRKNKIYYHALESAQEQDTLIYEEKDPTFSVDLSKSSSEEYIFVCTSSNNSSEVRFIKANDSLHQLQLLIERREDHLYSVDQIHNDFYIHTNDMGKNFRLVRLSIKDYKSQEFIEVIPHSADIYLVGFNLYNDNLVITTKELGLPKITILNYDLLHKNAISFPDPTYTASVIYSCADDKGALVSYSSLNTPTTVFKYNFDSKKLTTLKTQEIPSGYDKNLYESQRLMATANDGVKVPISLVYKKDLLKKDGSNPLYLYGYGSYGIAIPPSFNSNMISLLDAGFVYAIAHIRGGDDLGFEWYESAKFMNKKRTFSDYIAVADYLVKQKYTHAGNIAIQGGSAGGMLIGVAINERPELFKTAIADVPFVDVLNTMLDDSLPLTPGEFKEWGNPLQEEYFDYIKSYSPYDNIKEQEYPALYVLAGLNDPRVTYWEPAKFVAKLRARKKDKNILLLETEMNAGHGGKSSRFDRIKEIAREYAFILHEFGLK